MRNVFFLLMEYCGFYCDDEMLRIFMCEVVVIVDSWFFMVVNIYDFNLLELLIFNYLLIMKFKIILLFLG